MMPIVKVNGSIQLEFGFGDINVGSGVLKGFEHIGVLCFVEMDAGPIGRKGYYEPGEEVEVEETPVRMTFEKIESIDVLIGRLQETKKMMLANKTEPI